MSILKTTGLTMRFGGLTAVGNLDLHVPEHSIFSIIGPNGAGKTTVFNAITGIYEPTEGQIYFQGRDLRRQIDGRTWLGFAIVTVLVGLAAVVVRFLEPLWIKGVVENFKAGQAFSYGEVLADMFGVLKARPGGAVLAFLFGTALGGSGYLVVWFRTRRSSDLIASEGIARTFQNIRLFHEMTVLENVIVATDPKARSGILSQLFRLPWVGREEAEQRSKAMELLEFVGLAHRAGQLAKNLPYGEQRRLEIARALATGPKLLCLDEPAAGMNPSESKDLMTLIQKIRQRGVTVLLIEHHMKVVMGISDRIVVLDHGVKIAEGNPQEIQNNPKVLEAYLGKEEIE